MTIKEFYETTLGTIKTANDEIRKDVSDMRMFLMELKNMPALSARSYKTILGLIDAQLARTQGSLYIIWDEVDKKAPEFDSDQEEGDADDVH